MKRLEESEMESALFTWNCQVDEHLDGGSEVTGYSCEETLRQLPELAQREPILGSVLKIYFLNSARSTCPCRVVSSGQNLEHNLR